MRLSGGHGVDDRSGVDVEKLQAGVGALAHVAGCRPFVGEERAAPPRVSPTSSAVAWGLDSEHMFAFSKGVSPGPGRTSSNLPPTVVTTKRRPVAPRTPARKTSSRGRALRPRRAEGAGSGPRTRAGSARALHPAPPCGRPLVDRADHARRAAGPGHLGRCARPGRPWHQYGAGHRGGLDPHSHPAHRGRRRRRPAGGAGPTGARCAPASARPSGIIGFCGLGKLAKDTPPFSPSVRPPTSRRLGRRPGRPTSARRHRLGGLRGPLRRRSSSWPA